MTTTTTTPLPKAAVAILALPHVASLHLEVDGCERLWVCHLTPGFTTDALGGGGTIIDSNLRTIRDHVRGAYAMALPCPELPRFITRAQQQQQPQQHPSRQTVAGHRVDWDEPAETAAHAPCSYDPRRAEFSPQPCFARVGPVVAHGPRARSTAPRHLPLDAARLLQRFELSLDSVLTSGLANTKINKGAALAHSAIFHGLPARQLASAVHGATDTPVAARGRLETVRRLALANGLGEAARHLNACPWASDGCRDGCLVFSGRNAMGTAPTACKARRSLARLWCPQTFSVAMLWAIAREYARAQRLGLPLSLRLKGTDDLPHHLQRFHLTAPEAATLARRYGLPATPGHGTTLPEVLQVVLADGSLHWYEYTKAPVGGHQGLEQMRALGIDVTASLAADRQGGARAACEAARAGFRLAVPVAMPKGAPIPAELRLAPTLGLPGLPGTPDFGRVPADDRPVRLLCVDGDLTDLRWLDPQGPQSGGVDGIAVILRTKVSQGRGKASDAFSLAPTMGQWQALKGGGFAQLIP